MTLGNLLLSRVDWPDLRPYERAALRLTAGLGLTALAMSLLTLAGWFSQITVTLAVLTAIGVTLALRTVVRNREENGFPKRGESELWV